jgi:hypothetical protein
MPAADRPSCSSLSRALGEGLEGTASRLRFWLMVEQPGPWGHDALVESGFPPEVGARLLLAGASVGLRVLLIKRRDRPTRGPRRCFAAFTGRRDRALRSFEIDDPGELLDLDLPAMIRSRFRGLGTPLDGPLFLVCTHGKHDACCARHGAPLSRARSLGVPKRSTRISTSGQRSRIRRVSAERSWKRTKQRRESSGCARTGTRSGRALPTRTVASTGGRSRASVSRSSWGDGPSLPASTDCDTFSLTCYSSPKE